MNRLKNTAIWMALILLYACGSSIAPETEVTQSASIPVQVQDINQITQNTEVIYTGGTLTIIATIYDYPDTDRYGDLICQTVYSNYGATSVAMDCKEIGDTK